MANNDNNIPAPSPYYSRSEVLAAKMLSQAKNAVLDEIKKGKVLPHPGSDGMDRVGIWLFDAKHVNTGSVAENFFVKRIADLAAGRLAASKLDTHNPDERKAHDKAARLIGTLQKNSGAITATALGRPLNINDLPEPLAPLLPQIDHMIAEVQNAHIADRTMVDVRHNQHEQAKNQKDFVEPATVTPNAPLFKPVPPGHFNKRSVPNATELLPPPPDSHGDDLTVREHPTLPQQMFKDGNYMLHGPRSKPLKDKSDHHAVPMDKKKKPSTLGAPDDDEKGPIVKKPGKEQVSLDPREADHTTIIAQKGLPPLTGKTPGGNSIV